MTDDDPLWEQRVLHNETRPEPFERARAMKPAVLYLNIFPEMRDKARELGYALMIHGSMGKDLDLFAAPWVEDAAEESVLVAALCEVAGLYNLESLNPPGGKPMPHGRHAYTLVPGGPLFIDLSVMPRSTDEGRGKA